jgi:uroporphyrin-III C-methyltransferase
LKKGSVAIVGAGPGHPDYLTLRGLRLLEQADVILYDALLHEDFLKLFPEKSERQFVGKRRGVHSITQEKINELLVSHAKAGKKVLRLKGGDAFVFGRGGEEVLALKKENIAYEIVPGVSAVSGAGTLAHIPLTHRQVSSQFWVIECSQPGRDELIDWKAFSQFNGTAVILMGSHRIQEISKKMVDAGGKKNLPMALVEGASFPDSCVQRTTLEKAACGELKQKTIHPGILYFGATVEVLL